MKRILLFIALASFSLTANSQANKTMNSWAELNNFHKVLTETYQPSKDGNLKAIIAEYKHQMELAVALHQSIAPAGFDAAKMSDVTTRLAVACKELFGLIELNESDESITKKLGETNSFFTEIARMCESNDVKGHDHSDPNHKH